MLDPRLAWTDDSERTARVAFTTGPHRVTATLEFNDDGELIGFSSDDRPERPFADGDATLRSLDDNVAGPIAA